MEKPREVFVIHHFHPDYTADVKMKIGFILWLKNLAQELDYSLVCSSFGVALKRGEDAVVFCGVRPLDQSAMVDFLSLLIDKKELKNNQKLFSQLTLIDARPTCSLEEEEDKALWRLDPLREASRDLLIQYFENFWAEGIGEIFGCDVEKVERTTSCFHLVDKRDATPVAFLKNDGERIMIEGYLPFITSGLFREFYGLGKARPDKRFEPLFRVRQESLTIPLNNDDNYEDSKENY